MPVPLRRSAAQTVLDRVVPGFRVTGVVARAGGEVNRVYEVHGADAAEPLIIKLYPQRWQSPHEQRRSNVTKEVFVYRLLARHGIRQIPRVLHHEVAGVPALRSAYAVMTLLDGRPLSAVNDRLTGSDTEHVYEQMGRLLATVHQITAARWGYVTTCIVNVKYSNTAYMLDQFATKLRRFADLGGDSALGGAINRHVARHADVFAGCQTPALCHNDFHDGNVLVTRHGQGWQVTGYVDVENTVVADPLLDLAKTDYYTLCHDETRRRAFIRGYGQLPHEWPGRLALYRLHHALELWNWSASRGKVALLPDTRTDIERIINEDATPQPSWSTADRRMVPKHGWSRNRGR